MASRLIPLVFDDPNTEQAQAFRKHLQELLNLSESDLKLCLNSLSEIRLVRTNRQRQDFFDRLGKASSADRHQTVRAIGVLNFFVDGLLSGDIPDDDYMYWTDDLSNRDWVTGKQQSQLQDIIDSLVETLPLLRAQSQERHTTEGILPTFKVLGYTVEVRPIRKEIYRWGTNIEEYRPEILGTVEVASIHIGVDVGPVSDIYFQADEGDIDAIIATLSALKKDLAALRKHLNLADN